MFVSVLQIFTVICRFCSWCIFNYHRNLALGPSLVCASSFPLCHQFSCGGYIWMASLLTDFSPKIVSLLKLLWVCKERREDWIWGINFVHNGKTNIFDIKCTYIKSDLHLVILPLEWLCFVSFIVFRTRCNKWMYCSEFSHLLNVT